MMKTYITPDTEYTMIIKGGILCGSYDNIGVSETINGDKTGTGNDAPGRKVF